MHNTNCYAKTLEDAKQFKPTDMLRPHAHHILFKEGIGPLQKAYSLYGKQILKKHDIGIDSIHNLTWAPNVKGLHRLSTLKPIVKELRDVHKQGGNRDDIIAVLTKHGKKASEFLRLP